MAPPEPPLSERELKIVRGIIDSYEQSRWEHRFWASIGGYAVKAVVALGAIAVLASAIKDLWPK